MALPAGSPAGPKDATAHRAPAEDSRQGAQGQEALKAEGDQRAGASSFLVPRLGEGHGALTQTPHTCALGAAVLSLRAFCCNRAIHDRRKESGDDCAGAAPFLG